MYPELFHIGSFTVYSYGFFIIVGVFFSFIFMYRNRDSLSISVDKISELYLFCFATVFVGGKLFFFLEKPSFYISQPSEILSNIGQGFVFYGSFLVTIPTLIWWFKRNKINVNLGFDYLAISGSIVHGFGKIGCFLAGCCHGIVCNPKWGVVFTSPLSMADPLNVPVYPVQLWDASVILSISVFLIFYRSKKKFNGELFLIYAIVYSIARFFTELYRGDVSRGYLIDNLLTHSQAIAIIIILCSVFYYLKQINKVKKVK